MSINGIAEIWGSTVLLVNKDHRSKTFPSTGFRWLAFGNVDMHTQHVGYQDMESEGSANSTQIPNRRHIQGALSGFCTVQKQIFCYFNYFFNHTSKEHCFFFYFLGHRFLFSKV